MGARAGMGASPIERMLHKLDAHTTYIDPESKEQFDKDLPDSIRMGQRITTMTSGQAQARRRASDSASAAEGRTAHTSHIRALAGREGKSDLLRLERRVENRTDWSAHGDAVAVAAAAGRDPLPHRQHLARRLRRTGRTIRRTGDTG